MSHAESISADVVEFAANMLKTVGHPVRLRIVELLQALEEAPVNRIQDELQLSQPVVSQHLTKMKALGLLKAQRRGGMMYYSVALPQLFKLLECIRGCPPSRHHQQAS
jgi:DNA-binding transcriptional ArsR family regulator